MTQNKNNQRKKQRFSLGHLLSLWQAPDTPKDLTTKILARTAPAKQKKLHLQTGKTFRPAFQGAFASLILMVGFIAGYGGAGFEMMMGTEIATMDGNGDMMGLFLFGELMDSDGFYDWI